MSTQNSLLKDQAVKPNEFEAHAIKTGLIFLANTGNEINIVSVVKVKPVLSDVPTPRKHHTTPQHNKTAAWSSLWPPQVHVKRRLLFTRVCHLGRNGLGAHFTQFTKH